MKKFLIRITLVFIMVCTLTLLINKLYIGTGSAKEIQVEKFSCVPSHIQLCNFGSSHGLYGYCYDDIQDLNCFNFSLSAQTLSYDKRILECYSSKIDKNSIILITISYLSLFCEKEDCQTDFKQKNKRYYIFLPKKYIKKYDSIKEIFYDKLPALIAYENIISFFPNKSPSNNGLIRWQNQTALDIDLHKDVKAVVKNHCGSQTINQEELSSLYQIIDYCGEKGFTPILITTPYLNDYISQIIQEYPGFLDKFYNTLQEVINNTGIKYYDYSFDKRFLHNYYYFMNGDHLNKKGAEVFTNIVMEEVINKN